MSIESQLVDYLDRHNVITLATTAPDGPWAAAVFYVRDGFDLIFLSAAHTRHAQHLAADARVAGTIQDDTQNWADIQGIQLEGEAVRLSGEARVAAMACYQQKFPFVAPGAAAEVITRAMAKVDFYRLTPRVLHFIDNSKGFGHRAAWVPGGG